MIQFNKFLFFFFFLFVLHVKAQEAQEKTVTVGSADVTTSSQVVKTKLDNTNIDKPTQFNFSGDIRYRLQSETQEPKQARSLQRLQVRLQTMAEVQENLKVILRMMTGSGANSGNQTLGDDKNPGMVRRSFGLDYAFIDYKPASVFNLYLGRMPQPFQYAGKHQLILDRDIALEGFGLKFKTELSDKFQVHANGGSFLIRENYDTLFNEDQTDNLLNGGQIGLTYKSADLEITGIAGFYGFTSVKDIPPANLITGGAANGNTLDSSGNYPQNFDLEEYALEAKKKLFGADVGLFWVLVKNKDADLLNKASMYGFNFSYSQWNFQLGQQKIEKDSVIGVFTDSDFAGGQTSSEGYVWSLGYKFSKKAQLLYTVFKNKNQIDILAKNYDRSHIDLTVSF